MSTQVGLHPGLADAERLLDGVVIAAVCVGEERGGQLVHLN